MGACSEAPPAKPTAPTAVPGRRAAAHWSLHSPPTCPGGQACARAAQLRAAGAGGPKNPSYEARLPPTLPACPPHLGLEQLADLRGSPARGLGQLGLALRRGRGGAEGPRALDRGRAGGAAAAAAAANCVEARPRADHLGHGLGAVPTRERGQPGPRPGAGGGSDALALGHGCERRQAAGTLQRPARDGGEGSAQSHVCELRGRLPRPGSAAGSRLWTVERVVRVGWRTPGAAKDRERAPRAPPALGQVGARFSRPSQIPAAPGYRQALPNSQLKTCKAAGEPASRILDRRARRRPLTAASSPGRQACVRRWTMSQHCCSRDPH